MESTLHDIIRIADGSVRLPADYTLRPDSSAVRQTRPVNPPSPTAVRLQRSCMRMENGRSCGGTSQIRNRTRLVSHTGH